MTGDDLVVRQWAAPRRAVCLLLDHSGSMRGDAVARSAVAAAAVVLATSERAACSEFAFAAYVRPVVRIGQPRPPAAVVNDLVALRGGGTTDLAAALRASSRELAAAPADERIVVLLSDCAATVGDDPLDALGGIDRLHIVSPGGEREDSTSALALAERSHGRLVRCTTVAALPRVLTELLA
jgi:uncharacterized protein with von Willebrand factor type A (vWA) domain